MIGFDIAKSVFQVHGGDSAERIVIKAWRRRRKASASFIKGLLKTLPDPDSDEEWPRESGSNGFRRLLISST
jgi:hypothetical protein